MYARSFVQSMAPTDSTACHSERPVWGLEFLRFKRKPARGVGRKRWRWGTN